MTSWAAGSCKDCWIETILMSAPTDILSAEAVLECCVKVICGHNPDPGTRADNDNTPLQVGNIETAELLVSSFPWETRNYE